MTMPRPTLTVSEAATACLVAHKTITRRLPQLQELGAAKDATGQWHIPVEALLAVGLKPGRPMSRDGGQQSQGNVTPDHRAELDAMRHRAELAEARYEAERRANDLLALLVHQLAAPPAEPATVTPRPRRSWWAWLTGE